VRTTKIASEIARFISSLRRVLVIVSVIAVAACTAGPPVQEMSDARQAIAVAREAGAAELAPADLREAEAYLESAQQNLSRRAYKDARTDAVQAKLKALDALASAENSAETEPR
jgi:hypothetical protein